MITKQPLSDQNIIDCLNTNYGIKITTLTLLPLGADMNAWVYKAETDDQSSYFVKIKREHHHDVGIAIMEQLDNAGIQNIIPPIKTINNQLIAYCDDVTCIVYPFIQGQDGFTRSLTDEQWVTLGKTLKHIHEIDVPLSIQDQIRQETYSREWHEFVRSLYPRIQAEPIGDEIALKLLAFMKEHILTIRQLVDRSEQLAQRLQNESHTFVLCHSDIHGGNVLMDDNNALFIVDWDDPIMAPKERDLMFIGGGVASVWNKPHEEALFYKGYGPTDVNKAILAYYRHERIVQDIAEYAQALLFTDAGGEDRAEMYKHFIAMFDPNGVVDIACKTDEQFFKGGKK